MASLKNWKIDLPVRPFFTENLAESTLESGLDLGAMDFIQDEQDQALSP